MPDAPDPVRVLVVDDDDAFAQLIGHLLESEDDFELIGRAANGREGVELAVARRPDLVVMDVHMPLLGGFEATKRLHRLELDADVLLISGEDVSAHFHETGAVGAVGYLPKSDVPSKLVETLRAIVAARGRRLRPDASTA